jgi:hypothetical protein
MFLRNVGLSSNYTALERRPEPPLSAVHTLLSAHVNPSGIDSHLFYFGIFTSRDGSVGIVTTDELWFNEPS